MLYSGCGEAMGKEIVYCGGCGKSLREEEFARGKAHTFENRPFCAACKPLPATPPTIQPPSSSRMHKAVPSSHTRRAHAETPVPSSRKALLATLLLSGGAMGVLFIWLIAGGKQTPPQPLATPKPDSIVVPADLPPTPPAAPELPRKPPPPPPPPPPKDPALAFRELEALAASSADPDTVLQRCQELLSALRGTPHEANLRALEQGAFERRKARDQERQLNRSLEEARKLIASEHAALRKEEILGLLKAARAIAGERRAEVDRLAAEYETRLKEPSTSTPPPCCVACPMAQLVASRMAKKPPRRELYRITAPL